MRGGGDVCFRYRATTLYRDQWLRWFSNFLEILLEALRPGKPVHTQPDGGAVSRLTLGCSPRPSVSSQAQRTFDGEMSIRAALASIVTSAALRALPVQLDLFTAIAGGGSVGGIVGGAVAWLLDKDLAQGGILGGLLGLILGALLAVLQSSGLYS